MPTDATTIPAWVSLLIQVPLVGVFIWYSLKLSEQSARTQEKFMDALDSRDAAFQARNEATIKAIGALSEAITRRIDDHDAWVRENVSRGRRTAK